MKFLRRVLILSLLLPNVLYASHPQELIHTYLSALKTDKEDSNKVRHLAGLCWNYRIVGKMDSAIKMGNEAIALGKKTGFVKGLANAYCDLGVVYYNEGNYIQALDYFFKSLKLSDSLKNSYGQGINTLDIGNVYIDQGDYTKALEYYNKALIIDTKLNDTTGIEILNENIGTVYERQGDYKTALKYLTNALALSEELRHFSGIARSLNNIGLVYYDEGNYDRALDNLLQAAEAGSKSGDKSIIAGNNGDIGKTYLKLGKYKEAEKFFIQAAAIADSIHYGECVRDANKGLSELYYKTGQWQKAYDAYAKYTAAKDSLFSIEKNKELTSNELKHDFEIKEARIKADQDKKDAIVAAEKNKQSIIIYSVSAVWLLVLFLAGLILRSYRQKQKANLLLEEKNKTIEEQKQKVDAAYGELHEKHKEITDSINYAQRIQRALFKDEEYVTQHLPEHYILFKPRNVVSGDFYWGYEKDDYWYVAAVDCTGHGVPGAFLTMLGTAFLNEICSGGLLTPAEILDQLRDKIVQELSRQGEVKDGMDISLCRINTKTKEVQWAGANNPLWYLQGGELKEITADKQPIGYQEGQKQFTNHTINLDGNDIIYLFTDGYADQFGGPKGKKFKYKQFQQLIMDSAQLPMHKQKEALHKTFESWKGSLEQTDDVCVIGIRI